MSALRRLLRDNAHKDLDRRKRKNRPSRPRYPSCPSYLTQCFHSIYDAFNRHAAQAFVGFVAAQRAFAFEAWAAWRVGGHDDPMAADWACSDGIRRAEQRHASLAERGGQMHRTGIVGNDDGCLRQNRHELREICQPLAEKCFATASKHDGGHCLAGP